LPSRFGAPRTSPRCSATTLRAYHGWTWIPGTCVRS
jgi:hypothetical protein